MPYTKKITFTYDHSSISEVIGIKPPNICPRCSHGIEPVFISMTLDSSETGSILYFCNYCSNSFITSFTYSYRTNNYNNRVYYFNSIINSFPTNFNKASFSEAVNNISKNFSNIYNQALQAESLNLNEIAGMGYRKALEFLIKDFSIYSFPNDAVQIASPKTTLGTCISKYITSPDIKTLSKAASYLGNDETHYTRIFLDKDINHLKSFIQAVVFYIDLKSTVDSAFSLVSEKK